METGLKLWYHEKNTDQKAGDIMLKKIFIGLLAAACVCCLSGCVIQLPSQNPATSSPSSQTEDTTSKDSATPSSSTNTSSQSSTPSSDGEIGREDAFSIALENAGISQSDVYNIKIERDGDNGIPIFDIEFETDYGDFDYEVAIADGSIIGSDCEIQEEWAYRQPNNPVSEDQVKTLVQQKVPGAPLSDIRVWQESDDGRLRYEGNLSYNNIYYEFEVDSQTGIILDWNADYRR